MITIIYDLCIKNKIYLFIVMNCVFNTNVPIDMQIQVNLNTRETHVKFYKYITTRINDYTLTLLP